MKLYELTSNYQNLLDLMDDETIPQEEITKALNGLEGEFDLKAENIAKLIKSMDADVKGLKDEEKRLANRRKALENRCISLKGYLSDSMRAIGRDKIKGSVITLQFQKNAPSVNVTNVDSIPRKYFIKPVPMLQKAELLIALKNGLKVKGAELKQESSLRIK